MNPLAVAQEVSNSVGISNPAGNHQSTIRIGELVVDIETRIVEADGKPVRLTGKEYRIIELLSLRQGATVTKEMFLGHLYGGMDEPKLKIIDVFVCKLRKKLAQATGGKHYIKTVWGRGYRLCDPAEIPSQPILDEAGCAAARATSDQISDGIDTSKTPSRSAEGSGAPRAGKRDRLPQIYQDNASS
jgi:DNA-binding winged helix-turn-helix (wHTH) protein